MAGFVTRPEEGLVDEFWHYQLWRTFFNRLCENLFGGIAQHGTFSLDYSVCKIGTKRMFEANVAGLEKVLKILHKLF